MKSLFLLSFAIFLLSSFDFKVAFADDDIFAGRYQLTTSENFSNFLKAMGVGFFLRLVADNQTPVYDIHKDGDKWVLKTTTTFRNSEIKFKYGEEFTESRLDGKNVRSTITQDGNKWIHTQIADGSPTCTLTREFSSEGIDTTGVCDSVTTRRYYKRI